MNVRLKACVRCGGDVFIEHDIEGRWLVCLQCGRSILLSGAVAQARGEQKSGVA
jgi:DNA-directed RNA polymerase subunit RPC12/RpoP